MNYTLHNGNSAEILKQYPDNHFDSIVTDPPYGINFLGKSWDSNTGEEEVYRECLRVLKPGGHILAFSAARTYHHLAMALEMAGFEIRDQIMWIYGSGFPKSQDVGRSIQRSLGVKETKSNPNARKTQEDPTSWSKTCKPDVIVATDPTAIEWSGWGTQLKPAHEPICMARKPITQTVAKNCQQYGVGAINIDASRIGDDGGTCRGSRATEPNAQGWANMKGHTIASLEQGRFPSNVIGEIDEPYQKYFYCPKVSRKERHLGFDEYDMPFKGVISERDNQKEKIKGNNHPTVKPIELMKYLIKLVTPPNSKVLDPFNGSGSTGCAAVELGHHYTGIDLDEKYVEISEKRIIAHNKEANTFNQLFE